MADTVNSTVVFSGTRRRVVKITNISDGTGEADVVKVDVSALIGPDGSAPTSVVIEEIQWSINGFTSVRLHWDADEEEDIAALGTGNGYFNFRNVGGFMGTTDGDLLLTTAGNVAGATYDITVSLRLKD